MTKLRVQNNSKATRGIYVAGRLTFIEAGKTRTFSDATSAEIAEAANVKAFRVQKGKEGAWEELSQVEVPKPAPFLVVATDATGGNMRAIALNDGEWFAGMAVASDKPDTAGGYTYQKIGGTSEVPLTEKAAVDWGHFDPVAYLNTAAKNLDFTGKSQEMLNLLLETEKANKDRLGVIAAIEELLTSPAEPETEEQKD